MLVQIGLKCKILHASAKGRQRPSIYSRAARVSIVAAEGNSSAAKQRSGRSAALCLQQMFNVQSEVTKEWVKAEEAARDISAAECWWIKPVEVVAADGEGFRIEFFSARGVREEREGRGEQRHCGVE